MKNKRLLIIFSAIVVMLAIPLIAMQFTDSVNWKMADFVMMGLLLTGTGLLCEFVLRKVKKAKYRLMICAAIILLFLLIWAELAVGIFGTPFAGS